VRDGIRCDLPPMFLHLYMCLATSAGTRRDSGKGRPKFVRKPLVSLVT